MTVSRHISMFLSIPEVNDSLWIALTRRMSYLYEVLANMNADDMPEASTISTLYYGDLTANSEASVCPPVWTSPNAPSTYRSSYCSIMSVSASLMGFSQFLRNCRKRDAFEIPLLYLYHASLYAVHAYSILFGHLLDSAPFSSLAAFGPAIERT